MQFWEYILSFDLLIGLVLWMRSSFRKKLAPGVIYALWLIPLLRLFLPVTWETPVFGTVADILNAPYELVLEWTPGERENTSVTDMEIESEEWEAFEETSVISEQKQEKESLESPEKDVQKQEENVLEKAGIGKAWKLSAQKIFFGVWALGSLGMGAIVSGRNRQLKKEISSMPASVNRDGLVVRVSESIEVPCLVGIVRPEILLPKSVFQDPELYEYALRHERAHYQQKDHLWTALRIFLCILYWWNPFVWLAARCVEEDAELACDARVLKGQPLEERRKYGYALLSILEQVQKKNYGLCMATSLDGSKKSMKKRIEEIAAGTVTKKRVLLPSLLLLTLVFFLGCAVPTQKSWLKTAEWKSGSAEDVIYSEAEYSYVLQEEMKSILLYSEVYQYGELLERKVLSYGTVEGKRGTIKLRNESGISEDKRTLIMEMNGVGIEMEAPAAQYAKGEHGNTALQSEEGKIEVLPGTDLILLSDCYADTDTKIFWYDCKEFSGYTEEERAEILKENYVISFVRILFSDKPAEELAQEFVEGEVLPMGMFLDAVYSEAVETTDWSIYSNGVRDDLSSAAQNYYISYPLSYMGQELRLDFSYEKETDQLTDVYLMKESDKSQLWIYEKGEAELFYTVEEILDFIRIDHNILNEISFALPQGVTLGDYNANVGTEGGCLILPMVYEGNEESIPAFWRSSGMISRYRQDSLLEWEGEKIETVYSFHNHTSMEILEQVEELCAPALLTAASHELYTASDLGELEEEGVDIETLELTSDYWELYIAEPGAEYGYVITLNQKHYTKEDVLELGKTIQLLEQ